jgi:protein subunit release factor B
MTKDLAVSVYGPKYSKNYFFLSVRMHLLIDKYTCRVTRSQYQSTDEFMATLKNNLEEKLKQQQQQQQQQPKK